MQLDYDIIPEVLLWATIFFIILYVLYRRYIYSFIDPLFIFVFTTAFASVLVINVLEDTSAVVSFFVCQLFLFLGFDSVQRFSTLSPASDDSDIKFGSTSTLEMTVYILFFMYVIGNIVLFFTKGFALLSDNPSDSKVADFRGGFGIIRKINWSAGSFVTTGLLYLYLKSKRKKYLFLLLIVIIFTAVEGSKGSLLKVLAAFAFLAYHPIFRGRAEIFILFKRYIPIGTLALITIFSVVLLKENQQTDQAMFALARRFLYSADSILYYYTPVNINYFSRYNFMDYPAYLANPVLGFFRIAPYKEVFGNIMVENALPDFAKADVIVGPNIPFYIEGQIFFGYYGAFIHSFLIGASYSLIRLLFFSLKSGSSFFFIFLCTLSQIAGNIITDTSLFVTMLSDTCVFVLPVYILTNFILHSKVTIKHVSFSRMI
ncbi:hypothetical protein [Spirosoma luteum]|uniref:hypothetical protein n=1 Tax=Spirosoma luteum TaxID=431553 RepID=UPI00038295CA|nr:hypothetical protein [Spirosoma luteum]